MKHGAGRVLRPRCPGIAQLGGQLAVSPVSRRMYVPVRCVTPAKPGQPPASRPAMAHPFESHLPSDVWRLTGLCRVNSVLGGRMRRRTYVHSPSQGHPQDHQMSLFSVPHLTLAVSEDTLEQALRKARLVTNLYMMIQTMTSGRTSPRVPLSTLQDKAQVSIFPDVFLGTVQPEAQATHSTHTPTASQITSLTTRCDLHYPKSSTRLFKIRATVA